MRVVLLALLLFAPPALAQDDGADPDQGEPPEANVESTPGWTYGAFVLVATLLIGGTLAWLSTRRGSRGRQGGWKPRP